MKNSHFFTDQQRRSGMRFAILGQCLGMISMQALWTGGLAMIIVLAFSGSGTPSTNIWAMMVHSALHFGFLASVYTSLRPLPNDRMSFMLGRFRISTVCLLLAALVVWKAPVVWVVPLFTMLLIACRVIAGAAGAYWFPILQDTVPEDSRGRFFSILRASWGIVALLSTLALAAVLDTLISDASSLEDRRVIYAVMVAVLAVLFGLRNIFFHRMPKVPRDQLEENPTGGWRQIREALAGDARYRYFLKYLCLLHLFIAVEQPMLIRMLKAIGTSDGTTLQIGILGLFGSIIAFLFCTTLVDRVGPRRVFAWGHFVMGAAVMALAAFSWLPAGQRIWLLGWHIIAQGMLAAVGVAATTYLFHILSGTQRSLRFSLTLVGMGVTTTISTLFLGYFLDQGPAWTGWGLDRLATVVFIVSGAMLVLTLPMTRGIDDGDWPARVDVKI